MTNAIILCGGLSTRLGEITKHIPKILVEVGDKTVLDWQLEKLKKIGVTEVVLAAGHLAHVLLETVGEERLGVRLIYAIEKERLGTGGAIKNAMTYVRNEEGLTCILNGDILSTVDLSDMVQSVRPESDGIILGTHVPDAASYGTITFDAETKRLIRFEEKRGVHEPGYINGAFYIFTPRMKRYFPDQAAFSIEYDVFPRVQDMDVYPSDTPWIDVGVPERLAWARAHWSIFVS